MYATLRCMDDYRDVNRASWDERAPAHAASPDYAVARFIDDPSFLSEVVSFDLPRLGDIAGLEAVHLQCHIGTDTVSLARLGARMTGLDFSPAALEQARAARRAAGADVDFVESELYGALEALGARALRPRLHRHRRALLAARRPPLGRRSSPACCGRAAGCSSARATRCCGRSATTRADGLLVLEYPYFERAEPTSGTSAGTYVETESGRSRTTSRTSGTTASARSSPRCSTPAWSSRCSRSTTACRGTRCPAR